MTRAAKECVLKVSPTSLTGLVWLRDLKASYVCVSLLCPCGIKVALKQEVGGGGWSSHFRGAAVMRGVVNRGGTDSVNWP